MNYSISYKIALLIPAYNVELFIDRCIRSCLAQRKVDFFLCCIDDGSSDATYEHLNRLSKEDRRVYIRKRDYNAGPSFTRNELLEWAGRIGCDYFMFIDADDWLENVDYCFTFLAHAVSYHADLVVSPFLWNRKRTSMAMAYHRDDILNSFFSNEIHGAPYNKLFKYYFDLNCRFPEGICYAEDALFFLTYLLHDKSLTAVVSYIDGYCIQCNPTSLSRNPALSLVRHLSSAEAHLTGYEIARSIDPISENLIAWACKPFLEHLHHVFRQTTPQMKQKIRDLVSREQRLSMIKKFKPPSRHYRLLKYSYLFFRPFFLR